MYKCFGSRQMYLKEIHSNYERGLSFFSLYKAKRDTLATFTTLKRTPVKIKINKDVLMQQ